MPSARQICLNLLVSAEKNSSYSNIALDNALLKHPELKEIDKRFVSALFYGVLERKLTLDEIIGSLSSRPLEKLDLTVLQILRMGIYQLLYLDSVPDSAAVNESVKLTQQNKLTSAKGFVNAVLRGFIRNNKKLPEYKNQVKSLSVQYSCPEWLVSMWISDYGEEVCRNMLETSLGKPPVTIRLNTCKFDKDEILKEFEASGVELKPCHVENAYEVLNTGSVEGLSAYQKGMFHVQDLSCQICSSELDAKSGDTVLDVCSAPGGKTFSIAEIIGDTGRVIACDLHENRVKLIASGAKRLNLSCVEAIANNAKIHNPDFPIADAVLCDVPCSGLGVIRRKPEIKYTKQEAINNLPSVQYDILHMSANYVKKGGILVYSTCTVNKAENEDVVNKFLSEHPDFEGVKLNNFTDFYVTITPEMFNSDGFFIAKLRRKE